MQKERDVKKQQLAEQEAKANQQSLVQKGKNGQSPQMLVENSETRKRKSELALKKK